MNPKIKSVMINAQMEINIIIIILKNVEQIVQQIMAI